MEAVVIFLFLFCKKNCCYHSKTSAKVLFSVMENVKKGQVLILHTFTILLAQVVRQRRQLGTFCSKKTKVVAAIIRKGLLSIFSIGTT